MKRRGMPIPPGGSHGGLAVCRQFACALIATWESAGQADFLPRLGGQFGLAGLDDEIEPKELEIVQTPAGSFRSAPPAE